LQARTTQNSRPNPLVPPQHTCRHAVWLPVLAESLSHLGPANAGATGRLRIPQPSRKHICSRCLCEIATACPPYGVALTALAPAVATTVSCGAVPPLTPMAPTSLPFRTIGSPPSEAIGRTPSGKVMKATLPAEN